MAPFDLPVVPEVNKIAAVSSSEHCSKILSCFNSNISIKKGSVFEVPKAR